MHEIKDTKRANVRIGYDGRVHKYYLGGFAKERFQNELRMLKYLEEKGCKFVPRVLEYDNEKLYLQMTSCGKIVSKMSPEKLKKLFGELESFGVRHDDPFVRNVTYNDREGRFCVIDFEFATFTESGEGLRIKDVPVNRNLDAEENQ